MPIFMSHLDGDFLKAETNPQSGRAMQNLDSRESTELVSFPNGKQLRIASGYVNSIANWNMAIEIVGFPIHKMVDFTLW